VQFEKALAPRFVTVAGRVIVVRLEQLKKAELLIPDTLPRKVTLVRLEQPEKALAGIVLTLMPGAGQRGTKREGASAEFRHLIRDDDNAKSLALLKGGAPDVGDRGWNADVG